MTSTPPPYGQPDQQQPSPQQPSFQQQPYQQQPYQRPSYQQQPYSQQAFAQQPYSAAPGYQPGPGVPQGVRPVGYPPPPPGAYAQPVGRVPQVAWLVPVAALLAVIGAFTPWFDSSIVRGGQTFQSLGNLYSWRDGRIGLLPPIALVILSIGVVNLIRGRQVRRFSRGRSHPIVSAARGLLVIGAITAVCLAIAWAEVPSNYSFHNSYGGTDSTSTYLQKLSQDGQLATLSRGPQIGFYLTAVAGLLALLTGVLMLLMRDKNTAPATFATPPGWSAPPPSAPQHNPQTGWSTPTTNQSGPSTPNAGSGGPVELTK